MITLQVVSDVHVEFHADSGREWATTLKSADPDVLIVAGDFGTLSTLELPISILCDRFADVVYVTGNHEYYGSSLQEVHKLLDRLVSKYSNFHWLQNSTYELDGYRFLGTTLWFSKTKNTVSREWMINDFRMIDNATDEIYNLSDKSQKWLHDTVKDGDIVITHHLPSQKCVSTRFMGSHLNDFFVCDVEELMHTRSPKLWIHGHTHDSKDFMISNTRVVCNPFGYVRHELNLDYKEPKVLTID